ncbi:hypothetical protein H0I31_01580 [Tenacibaculum sp. AHE15PA]|uniref:DUF6438 domain-containing protein n=1 Tax=unclassified Tenacibaculum TaxID=2635139 RepID=UPI001C4EF7F4|nr:MULTISPECIES: DUF6438 domain-containing protein [unclassified Tenacibaculum]QXP72420.1 hypothetical protein H0I30_06840 [Tenacibaculum sp. AHE14PA]QXP76335.1 hypothetical protein H0I31_01580 [Tenacibaculum sp. AHE15PA]
MKFALVLLFALTIITCSVPKKELKKDSKPIEKEIIVEKTIDKTKKLESEPIKENNLVNIRKTPCFGDCAVYNVTIDKKGNVTFNGIEYVLEKGIHTFKLSDKDFKKLNDMFTTNGFNSFKTVYDNTKISDLPSTFITHNNKQIKIRLWKDIPDELINIHEYIEELLLDKNLIE